MATRKTAKKRIGTGEFMTLLKRHRLALGLSLEDLGKRLKVSTATVGSWETGRYIPRPKMVPRLARILQVHPFELTRMLSPGHEPQGDGMLVAAK